ncbi:hopanoid-associated sugar epimerase [Phaeobacter sp. CECT 5382]|uniref:NAD-dependent epimerase/dehydratase family protein n=1 Tax=Phaeobacter sp. CECT 5382 TaxID=1712645 RepID=UPI0006DB5599|nr:NAD-dependent epimerase/dehydratase family protein [Phaeobacter sp. CECT 5382]CUH87295.1 hopanoid-associated sugar epimerase [Phaeobacter sp. CECT 5382]
MNILILGGTGSIGSAVTTELVAGGHAVTGLCRSAESATKLRQFGATPVMGDLRQPETWRAALAKAEAVIQLASTFDDDMGAVDARALQAIRAEAKNRAQPLRLIYTGGCWLYGETGNLIAHENRPLRPIPAFAWMQEHAAELLSDSALCTAVVHPAMVYHEEGGVFGRLLQQANERQPLEVWGSLRTRWPLVHRRDLARAYRMLVDDATLVGSFNVAAQQGVSMQRIVDEIVRRRGHDGAYVIRSRKHVMFKHGAWAEGPTLDQQMSAEKLRNTCGWVPEVHDFTQADF